MNNNQEFKIRLDILLEEIKKKAADAILINSIQNRFWLLNFRSSAGYLLVEKNGKVTFLIDGRYYEEAQNRLGKLIDVVLLNKQVKTWDFLLKNRSIKKVLIEDEYATASFFQTLTNNKVEVGLFSGASIRNIKLENEITTLIKAANIACEVMDFVKLAIQPGMSEKAVAKMINLKFIELNATGPSFAPIVAAGINGANPHHKPSDKILLENEMVTVDLGCVYENYCSDMTRTFAVANTKLPPKLQTLHDAVFQSQKLGLEACKIGKSTYDVDKACRDYLSDQNLVEYFVHSTGHGVGIDIHEYPTLTSSTLSACPLENGHCVTVEPGVYLPGIGGVRIEDTVIIKDQEPLVLNEHSSKKANW